MQTENEDTSEPLKSMKLRYAGRCRTCNTQLGAGTLALYDRVAKNVICSGCSAGGSEYRRPPERSEPAADDGGKPGASAQREYDRRSKKRETKIRDNHPVIGGFILAVTDEPQSTRSWATGARGEERVGRELNGLAGPDVRVLHDRKMPASKANIDHIAVGRSGVFVVDAKKYTGRPSLRVEGGLFRPRSEILMVGSRKHTSLVVGVQKQAAAVRARLDAAGFAGIPLHGVLCFVNADWPLLGGDFTVDGVSVLWPGKLAKRIRQMGALDERMIEQIHTALASSFPPA
jgi:hypothetical protein